MSGLDGQTGKALEGEDESLGEYGDCLMPETLLQSLVGYTLTSPQKKHTVHRHQLSRAR